MTREELEQEVARLRCENAVLKAALSFHKSLLDVRAKAVNETVVRAEVKRMMEIAGLRK